MAVRNPSEIRNIALVGHAATGKTTLAERLLNLAGKTSRVGTVEDGSTVSDYTEEERHHKHSLQASILNFQHNGLLINLVDTPGLADFIGVAIAALPSVDTAAIVVDAVKGIEPMTRRVFAVARERRFPTAIIVNKIDHAEVDLEALVERLRSTFGSACIPVNIPTADRKGVVDVFGHKDGSAELAFGSLEEAHQRVIEQVVEVDESLTELYFERGDDLPPDRVHAALEQALREGHLVPILFCSAREGAGCAELLEAFERYLPSPVEGNPRPFVTVGSGGAETPVELKPEPDKPAVAHIFKVAIDPFVGKLGVFRVHQGTVRAKSEITLDGVKKPVRIGTLFRLCGKEHEDVDAVGPGEIAAVAKVDEVRMGGVLHADPAVHIALRALPLPKPMYGVAITLPNAKDEAKFGPAVAKLMAEDPCFKVEQVAATHQTVARGLGEMHIRVLLEKLEKQFGIKVETSRPKVAYTETISGKGDGHHRHKKQTGGSGEFGEVYLRVEPLPADHPEGFEFVNATVGGSIPRQFMPAIEKGIRQVLSEGAIAGYPMTGIKVEVYDGKYHDVDSKEVAFIKAGRRAFVEAVKAARPTLLEPFVMIEITAPSSHMGDIAGDLSTKRGRVQDSQVDGDTCVVKAVAPLSELQNYSNELKSLTAGAGSYAMDFSHAEPTPANIQAEVVASFKRADED